MAEKSRSARSSGSRKDALERVKEAHGFTVEIPLLGRVSLPPPQQLAYFGALGVLAVTEIIEWPVALVLAAGHVLAENQHNQFAKEVGEALEDA